MSTITADAYNVVDNGNGNYTIEGITSGTGATISVTDDAGCSTTLVTNPQDCNCPTLAPPTGAQDGLYCFGANPTALSVDDPGANYQVNWYTLQNVFLSHDNPYTPSGAGTYLVTLEELSSGCESASVTVVLTENPEIIIQQDNHTCAVDLLTYDLEVRINGGSGVYTAITADAYNVVDNGNGNYTIEGITSGTGATISVTDDAGCSTTLVTNPQSCDCPTIAPPVNAIDAVICFGDNPMALFVDDPGNGFEIQWYDSPIGGILLGTGVSFVPSGLGIYYAEKVALINGCVSSRIPVELRESPEIIFVASTEICSNQTGSYDLTIVVTGGTAPYQINAGILSVVENTPTEFTIENVNGTSGVSITISDDLGCTHIGLAQALVLMAPLADAGMAQVLSCEDTLVSLQASGSDINDYLWSGPNGFSSNLVNPSVNMAGIYTVIATNANGCSGTDQAEVTYDATVPLANAGPDQVITCKETCVLLQGTSNNANVTYNWTGPDPNLNASAANPTICVPGVYQLVVSDNNFCMSPPATVTVVEDRDTLSAIIVADPQVNTLSCSVSSITLWATGSSSGTDIINIWEDGIHTIYASSIVVGEPGMYTLTVIDTLNGCFDTEEFEVGSNVDYPFILFESPEVLTCTLDTLLLDASDSDINNPSTVEYQWSQVIASDTLSIVGATNLTLNVDLPGWYCLTAIDPANGCTNVQCIEVLSDLTLPTVEAGADQRLDCIQLESTLNGSVDLTSVSFNWTPSSGIVSGSQTLTPIVNATGTYYLEVESIENGCIAVDSLEVLPPQTPQPDYQILPITCAGEGDAGILIENVNGGFPPYLYSIDGGNSFSGNNQFSNLLPGSYNLLVQDATGCEHLESFSIVDATPLILVLESRAEIILGDSYQINTQTNITAERIDTLWWTPADSLSCSNCLDPLASPIVSTNYQLTVIDTAGCQVEARLSLNVDRRLEIFVPNAFSPNGDGSNDLFHIFGGSAVEKIETLQIFDRWGELVFVQSNFSADGSTKGWDGTLRGEPMNPGVFVYYAKIKMKDGRTELIEGDLLLTK